MAHRDDDAPTLLGLLLHRLGSPLGAIANYAHVLPPDDAGCKDGLVEAIGRARDAMDEARAWIEAARAIPTEAAATVDLHATLDAAAAEVGRTVRGPDAPLPSVAGPARAIRWLLEALLREADAVFPAGALIVRARILEATEGHPAGGVKLQIAPEGGRQGAPEATDRVRLADALARRLGGRVEPVEDAGGMGSLSLDLRTPPTPEATAPR